MQAARRKCLRSYSDSAIRFFQRELASAQGSKEPLPETITGRRVSRPHLRQTTLGYIQLHRTWSTSSCDERTAWYRSPAYPNALGPEIRAACTGISLQEARSSPSPSSARPKTRTSTPPLLIAMLRPCMAENTPPPCRERDPVNNPIRMSGQAVQ